MIRYITGDLLESNAQALVNTVNTVGVMGKGIALQFKKAFPNNFKAYASACLENRIDIGKLFVYEDSNTHSGSKIIINFPTKRDWRNPSEYQFIDAGLEDLVEIISSKKIQSVAIPPLGAGNGGLDWSKVKEKIISHLSDLDVDVQIYEPKSMIKESLKAERIKLTKARALLLFVLYDLVQNGEYVSEFSSEKVAYFLQRFGAEKYFKLKFEPNFYGPYSGKVRFLLNTLNGSYISGYSDLNKKPFEPLTLVGDGFKEVKMFIDKDVELTRIAKMTTHFLKGFYSDFALELLSSMDFISKENQKFERQFIRENLELWSDRKRTLISNERHFEIAYLHLQQSSLHN